MIFIVARRRKSRHRRPWSHARVRVAFPLCRLDFTQIAGVVGAGAGRLTVIHKGKRLADGDELPAGGKVALMVLWSDAPPETEVRRPVHAHAHRRVPPRVGTGGCNLHQACVCGKRNNIKARACAQLNAQSLRALRTVTLVSALGRPGRAPPM